MNPAIAVVYGGNSSEHEVSRRSGEFVAANIDRQLYDVYEVYMRGTSWKLVKADGMDIPAEGIEVDKDDFSVVVGDRRILFDYAFVMIHGTPGENGLFQGYLEMLGISSSGCSSFVSAVTFDKYSAKRYLKEKGFCKMADDIFMRSASDCDADTAISKLGLPMFVKPTDNGSSFGVTKVKSREQFDEAVRYAFSEGKSVLAERAISGKEIDDAVYFDGEKIVALPPIQIIPQKEYFDYEAKYEGYSQEICPAPISDEDSERIRRCSEQIYRHFGCAGVVRVDYFLADDGDLYFLEMNTVPGMTKASLVPQEVRAAGMEIKDFLNTIIRTTFRKRLEF